MATYRNKEIVIAGKRYLLGENVGNGGSGHVCSARIAEDTVEYAVKFLNVREGEANYKQKKKRFEQEIKFCEETNHQNIVKVFGHGEFEGQLCYVMKRQPKTLKDVIREEKDAFQLFNYIEQLCEAVKYIHKQGVVHRDIKPENIFLDSEGKILLADFGIAHFVDSTLTTPGEWLGNRHYVAPEQLIKGCATEVTTACDIYSIGMIINEMFTKSKPSGSKYITISEVEPIFSSMDDVVYRCMLQNPVERPEIDEVLAEITLLKGTIEQDVKFFFDGVLADEEVHEDEVEKILSKSCKDILIGKYIFQKVSDEDLDRFDCDYHSDIHYNASEYISNLYFQKLAYEQCLYKFRYESNVYSRGEHYSALNLENQSDSEVYKMFERIILQKKIEERNLDLTGEILKLFSSCCDYHCTELLRDILELEKQVAADLTDAPIVYIIYHLRKVFDSETIKEIDLIDNIKINWGKTALVEKEEEKLYKETDNKENYVLDKLKEESGVIWNRIDSKHFSVKFRDKDSYRCFRGRALEISKTSYVFEGDVLRLIRIKREYNGVIELEPLDSFDVNVIANILGIRNDYQ